MNKILLYQNAQIHYQISGKGRSVFLIHGFGEDGRVWKNQVPYLQQSFRLIIPDLPGSGKSDLIDDMSMEGMAEVIHAIIHEEGIDVCTVIGHSMGGYITLALVKKYWNHIRSFGLFHSTSFADTEEKKQARRKGIEFIKEHGAFEFFKTTTPNLFSPFSRDKNPDLINEHISGLSNFSNTSPVLYYEAMMARFDNTEVLRKTTFPVLFIIGEHDMAVSPADSLTQCHLPEKAYIHILKNSAHSGMLEEPEKCNRILEEFLMET